MGQVAELAETLVHSYNCAKNGTNCNQAVWLNYLPCRKQVIYASLGKFLANTLAAPPPFLF